MIYWCTVGAGRTSPTCTVHFASSENNELLLKKSKCAFGCSSIRYLGQIITSEGVLMYVDKVSAVMDWPLPQTMKDLRGFLGLTCYYRRFVQHCGRIVAPLSTMLKKNTFQRSKDSLEAFKQLKNAVSTTPVLTLPNFEIPLVVECDASNTVVGAVLLQQGKPIAFYSKCLNGKFSLLSAYDRELLALVLTVDK